MSSTIKDNNKDAAVRRRITITDGCTLVCGEVKYPVALSLVRESMPPIYVFDVSAADRGGAIKFTPTSEFVTLGSKESSNSAGKEAIPPSLITPICQPIPCKLVDSNGNLLHDFGDAAYPIRTNDVSGDGNVSVTVDKTHFYVGHACHSAGTVRNHVTFQFDLMKHEATPISVTWGIPLDLYRASRRANPYMCTRKG